MTESINALPPWLQARDALRLLGVLPQSLYASVSRGRIRSRPDARDPRRKLYSRDDVLRLAGRKPGAAPAREVALRAVDWGEPVLASALSGVVDGRLYYRGRCAVALARQGAGLEEAAQLLWGAPELAFGTCSTPAHRGGLRAALDVAADAAVAGETTRGRPDAELWREASGLVGALAQAWVGGGSAEGPLHRRIARRWGRPGAEDCVRRALVLLADHELNASTFAARVAASTGAPLAAAVLAGTATLMGPLHGGAAADLGVLLREAEALGPDAAVAARLRRATGLPAFGHRLYPQGDPRAALLLEDVDLPESFTALAGAVARIEGSAPNVDFALAAMAHAWDLPPDAPLALFAIARSVGWLAHALEQGASAEVLRPRARYCGPAPSAAG